MIKLKRRSGWSASGLILYVATVALLGTILIARGLRETRLQKKAENRQHQLTALCGALDEAAKSKGIDLHIFVRWPNEKNPSICFGMEGDTYTVLHDGRVDIYKLDGLQVQNIKKTWKDYPLFYSLGKK